MGFLSDLLLPAARRLFEPTRQNHALEHATVAVLLRRTERPPRMIGGAVPDGFYLHADLPSAEVESAAREALDRMQKGEGHLALSPFCGTNIAIAGAAAALACLLTLGTKARWRQLPTAAAAATGAILLAQPLGLLAQRHVTTTSNVADLRIVRVTRKGSGGRTLHKVETARGGG